MPLKKKRKTSWAKILITLGIIAIIVLMIISFPAPQHLTEIVVYQ